MRAFAEFQLFAAAFGRTEGRFTHTSIDRAFGTRLRGRRLLAASEAHVLF